MEIKALITLKNGVLDPQAKAIHHALLDHNFSDVRSVKMAKEIVLDIDSQDESYAIVQVEKMCQELLANTVIEDFEVMRK
ncbi:phosphoribosylformylglycinamidine synthase subunit PurS [Helicobacter equorum]|uniref:phosphoribosylformylglycinamidine synthase subunit PurS n=1 Tax=Helicobacter equorum TaxID=361872 RepID=UPI000CF18BC0|nr:phosphoribosylformylglycinamidine synthase subunit PurS [Helicobacter equorum]